MPLRLRSSPFVVLLTTGLLLSGCAVEVSPEPKEPTIAEENLINGLTVEEEASALQDFHTLAWSELLPLEEYPKAEIGSETEPVPLPGTLEEKCGAEGRGLWWSTFTVAHISVELTRERAKSLLEKQGLRVTEQEPGTQKNELHLAWGFYGQGLDENGEVTTALPTVFIDYYTPITTGQAALVLTTWGSCRTI